MDFKRDNISDSVLYLDTLRYENIKNSKALFLQFEIGRERIIINYSLLKKVTENLNSITNSSFLDDYTL
jgi:hypothetical protein